MIEREGAERALGIRVAKPSLPGNYLEPGAISGLPDRSDVAARSKLPSTWGDYVDIGCLGESELLLGRDLQERQGASGNEHDVRAQDSTGRDGCFRIPTCQLAFCGPLR